MLTQRERVIVSALAKVLLDVPQGPFPSVDRIALIQRLEVYLYRISKPACALYRSFLWIFEWSGLLYHHSFLRRFSRKSIAHQRLYLRAWRLSPWSPKRLLRRFIASIITMIYYAHPEVARACGWDPTFAAVQPVPALPVAPVVQPSAAGKHHTSRCHPERSEGSGSNHLDPSAAPQDDTSVNHNMATDTALFSPGFMYSAPPTCCTHQESVEILVIGSGAGGAVVAERLAALGHEVVILEEGPYREAARYRGDVMEALGQMYRDAGATATVGWPTILVPLGRCVGGTTVINSGTFLRPPTELLQHWVDDFGLVGWDAASLEPHLQAAESVLGVVPVPDVVQGPHARIFQRGAEQLGYSVHPLPRVAPHCRGSGVCCYGCPTNAKLSMALTVLPQALQQGARLYAGALVQRIEHRHGTALAVHGRWGERPFRIRAHTLIIAGGSLHTPVLLKNSGMGDRHGHIGRHLSIHPTVKLFAEMDEPVDAQRGVPQGAYCDALAERGIKLEGIFVPPAHIAMALLMGGARQRQVMERYRYLAGFGALISDSGVGRVLSFPWGRDAVYYSIAARDLPKFREALEFLARVFFAAGARRIYTPCHQVPVLEAHDGIATLQRVRLRRKDFDIQAFHPLGTCRMAADPRRGAVDPTGRLFSHRNVYIADGSLFPSSLGVNPQCSIMAAARKIAGHVHEAVS